MSAILPITLFHSDGQRLASIRSPRGCRFSLASLARSAPSAPLRPPNNFRAKAASAACAGGDHGHRHLWRPHPLCRPGPDGTNRLDHGPRRHDRGGGCPRASDPGDIAGDGARKSYSPADRDASGHVDAAGDVDPLPVMKRAWSEPRNRTTSATSSGSSMRPSGVCATYSATTCSRRDVAQSGLPLDLALLHRGPHEARADRVDADAVRRHFARQRLRPAEHGELGRRIMREQRRADLGGERGGVDDAACALATKCRAAIWLVRICRAR